jgi:hypothetical protein
MKTLIHKFNKSFKVIIVAVTLIAATGSKAQTVAAQTINFANTNLSDKKFVINNLSLLGGKTLNLGSTDFTGAINLQNNTTINGSLSFPNTNLTDKKFSIAAVSFLGNKILNIGSNDTGSVIVLQNNTNIAGQLTFPNTNLTDKYFSIGTIPLFGSKIMSIGSADLGGSIVMLNNVKMNGTITIPDGIKLNKIGGSTSYGDGKWVNGTRVTIDGKTYIASSSRAVRQMNTQSANFKNYGLFVEDGVVGEELALSKVFNWPDFVFESDYELNSINELESFIKINGHLPTMPSAAEVEENGIKVSDLTKRTVQTIEELTLHIIEQQKQIERLEKRLSSLEKN